MAKVINENIVRDFVKAFKAERKKPSAYDTMAKVVRVEGDTAWVHIAGGVDETPVKMTVDAKKGDDVQIRIGGGKAWITGNATAPPTDDATANVANKRAGKADKKAGVAKQTAEEAQETADVADGKATEAKETAEAILIFDTDYEIRNGTAYFTAYVYQGGVDIKTQFESTQFTWYLKNEGSATDHQLPLSNPSSGYTTYVDLADCGYGSEVVAYFNISDESELLAQNGNALTNVENSTYTVRASGDSVRVRDLSVTTTIYDNEKVMVVGNENEHLVTFATLQDYLNANLDKQVLFDTTANWDAQATLQSQANTLYVYTDYQTVNNQNVAGIKVGDGNAYLIDLPFTDTVAMNHISDTTRHITQAEREFWNNKVSAYYAGEEQLILTTA